MPIDQDDIYGMTLAKNSINNITNGLYYEQYDESFKRLTDVIDMLEHHNDKLQSDTRKEFRQKIHILYPQYINADYNKANERLINKMGVEKLFYLNQQEDITYNKMERIYELFIRDGGFINAWNALVKDDDEGIKQGEIVAANKIGKAVRNDQRDKTIVREQSKNLNREQIENYLLQQKNVEATNARNTLQILNQTNNVLNALSSKHKHSIHLILLSLYSSNNGGGIDKNWLNNIDKSEILNITGPNALNAHKILLQDGVLLDLLKLHVEKTVTHDNLRFTISNNGNVNIINGDTNEIVTSYIHENVNANTFNECSKLSGANSQRHCVEALGMIIGFFDSGDIKLGFFDNISEEQKLGDARAILKKLKWSVQVVNGKHSIVTFDELSGESFKNDRLNKDVKNTLTYLGFADNMIKTGNFINSSKPNLVTTVKESIAIVNRYPDIINVLGEQRFTEVKPRKFSRMSGLDLARRRIQNIMSPLLNGGGVVYGVQEGGSQMSFATVFESKIDRILYILHSQGKRLSADTMITIKGKINMIRNLENELNEFLNKFEKYVNENPNDGLKNIDESTINKLNVVSKQLGRQVVSMSNGIIKITNYLPSVVPKKSYNRM